jgi:hypothetical protein
MQNLMEQRCREEKAGLINKEKEENEERKTQVGEAV